MKDQDKQIFYSLFREAYRKCSGFPLSSPLSDSDSKLLSNKILEETGLVIGARSIKNYSLSIPGINKKRSKQENPSVATLDTLARYVLDAPYTTETERKENESHYPWWFQYRNKFSAIEKHSKPIQFNWKRTAFYISSLLILIIVVFLINSSIKKEKNEFFSDNFNSVSEDSLINRGWLVKSIDTTWWRQKDSRAGHLALYTLRGDNWALGDNKASIKNLLYRRIDSDCFMVESQLSEFIPGQNWQQAGIILSEDSSFTGKMIRFSISYNDFFGGFEKPPEIIIQAISSSESGLSSKPEEIAHLSLFKIEPGEKSLAESNLSKSSLKIEKNGSHYRLLFSTSASESYTFSEVVSGDYNIKPRYAAIFSIKGWSENDNIIPAYFDSFSIARINCDN